MIVKMRSGAAPVSARLKPCQTSPPAATGPPAPQGGEPAQC